MTKFVKCIDNTNFENYLTKGNIYKVITESQQQIFIKNDAGFQYYYLHRFEEVRETTNNFRFIPKTEITEVIVDGIDGILIKEE